MDKPRERRKGVNSFEVARLAGVSRSAVSRTFTDGASISQETREKVLSASDRLGYRPHALTAERGYDQTIADRPSRGASRPSATGRGGCGALEIQQYRKDGTPFRAMLFASPLNDGQGTITNHFLSYLDITRRFDAEERLRVLAEER